MLKTPRVVLALVAAALCALAATGGALAAAGGPTLISPHHGQRLRPGRIRLVVSSPVLPVFVQISPRRKLNAAGHLAQCVAVRHRCDFIDMVPWKHHPGKYIWISSGYASPGFWATTPGRYYWQAHYNDCTVTEVDSCRVVSAIGTFRVR